MEIVRSSHEQYHPSGVLVFQYEMAEAQKIAEARELGIERENCFPIWERLLGIFERVQMPGEDTAAMIAAADMLLLARYREEKGLEKVAMAKLQSIYDRWVHYVGFHLPRKGISSVTVPDRRRFDRLLVRIEEELMHYDTDMLLGLLLVKSVAGTKNRRA